NLFQHLYGIFPKVHGVDCENLGKSMSLPRKVISIIQVESYLFGIKVGNCLAGAGMHELRYFQTTVGYGILLIKRSEEHTSELQSRENLVCRLLLEKKKILLG